MRDLALSTIDRFRVLGPDAGDRFDGVPASIGGLFIIPAGAIFKPYKTSATVAIIAASGDQWDHVSVSTRSRCPNWSEMMVAFRLCFRDDETAVQYGVPPSDHVSIHPFVLHWWRAWGVTLPMPPKEFI